MKIGYARVSTEDQSLDLQHRALREAECERIFEDHISGAARKRPGLDEALATLRPGDVLVVWKLDRLGRSLSHLIDVLTMLGQKGIGFTSLSENIDTTTAGGRLVFHVVGSMAEFERSLIGERSRAGVAAARARGVKLGRKPALNAAQILRALAMIEAGATPSEAAEKLNVGRSTLYRALRLQKRE